MTASGSEGSLLAHLGLTAAGAARLAAPARLRLLEFLARWEAYQDALGCLALIETEVARLVTLQDLLAEALAGVGRYDEALRVVQRRLARQHASAAELLLGRIHLAAGDAAGAAAIARRLIESNGPATALGLAGDAALLQGDLAAAEAAFVRYQGRLPQSRAPLLGLALLHQRRGNPASASAYAVRCLTMTGDAPVGLLRGLRDFFALTGDRNHLVAANEQLRARFAGEMDAVTTETQARREGGRGGGRDAGTQRRREERKTVGVGTTVSVSPAERRELAKEARRLFGFDELLPFQAEIMAATRRRQHVLAVLPTGAGKSLCYQLPAFLDEGPTLVISPLIALMKDQIDGLPPALAPRAIAINSSLDGRDLRQAMVDIGKGRYRLVYAAPERLRQPSFLQALRQARISRLVIDEAHCVSMWGHDFRPDYLVIAQSHAALGSPPILAMTATAPPPVREDIVRRLFGLAPNQIARSSLQLVIADSYRPNLHLRVIPVRNDDDKRRLLLKLCQESPGSGIIYARSRQRCQDVAALLIAGGVSAEYYHAGLSDRDARQDRFMQGQTRVMVATIAFGMGVDKPDIRFILHDGLPDSLEAYTQEIGRAGRDGQRADCILIHSPYDRSSLARRGQGNLIDKEWLRQVFAAVKELLAGRNPGPVALSELGARLSGEGKETDVTGLRVALSVLEQAGLLRRRYDIPRQATLSLPAQPSGQALGRFVQAAGLSPRQTTTLDFLSLSVQTGLAPDQLEGQLLAWEAEGGLTLATTGRQMLLELGKAPANAGARIDSLISQYAAIQAQRLAQVVEYAAARGCRHGYLANYLGGAGRERCEACDYCTR